MLRIGRVVLVSLADGDPAGLMPCLVLATTPLKNANDELAVVALCLLPSKCTPPSLVTRLNVAAVSVPSKEQQPQLLLKKVCFLVFFLSFDLCRVGE